MHVFQVVNTTLFVDVKITFLRRRKGRDSSWALQNELPVVFMFLSMLLAFAQTLLSKFDNYFHHIASKLLLEIFPKMSFKNKLKY